MDPNAPATPPAGDDATPAPTEPSAPAPTEDPAAPAPSADPVVPADGDATGGDSVGEPPAAPAV